MITPTHTHTYRTTAATFAIAARHQPTTTTTTTNQLQPTTTTTTNLQSTVQHNNHHHQPPQLQLQQRRIKPNLNPKNQKQKKIQKPKTKNNNNLQMCFQVCREFLRGACKRAESECRFAHPQDSVARHDDGSITVCMDAVKGRCARDPCRYFHPPLHLQAQLKAAQTRATAVAAAAAVWLFLSIFTLYFLLLIPHNLLTPATPHTPPLLLSPGPNHSKLIPNLFTSPTHTLRFIPLC